MAPKILCVAEKPSIAKAVAGHLSGGQFQTRAVPGCTYQKNYEFDFDFGPPWGHCGVTMTSVSGHLTTLAFGPEIPKVWANGDPVHLFDAPVRTVIDMEDGQKVAIAKNIETQARYSRALFIWTDCDREGENIGMEVRDAAWKGKPNLPVKRARFSNIERAHIITAAKQPIDLDLQQANAVSARIELDLRIGAAFTRMQSLGLQSLGGPLRQATISYGSCQFPTLGFVVDRYLRVQNFKPEPFWSIRITHKWANITVNFLWRRNRLFDRAVVTILYERCLSAKTAKITSIVKRPTKKWKPLPLTTVELQKMASRFLNMNSSRAMEIAEQLYNKGFISYPRTETDRFDKGMDLRKLVEKQHPSQQWGAFAQGLTNGGFQQPREGRNDDKAHPPIHPVTFAAPDALQTIDHKKIYEFITRRFLACCSEDALGTATDVNMSYGPEEFHTHGLIVLQRNYLDVYPYDKWTSSQMLPAFVEGEEFVPDEAMMTDGMTTAPGYLTEPDLIALMDANGIGTDATMAEHIKKIQERDYVKSRPKAGGGAPQANAENYHVPARGGRGGRGGARGGRGGGRGGAVADGDHARGGVQEFIPTTLGVALVAGYDEFGFETSLSKPFLRKEMELLMKDICEGRKTKEEVVHTSLDQYRQVFLRTQSHIDVLKNSCRRYIAGLEGGPVQQQAVAAH